MPRELVDKWVTTKYKAEFMTLIDEALENGAVIGDDLPAKKRTSCLNDRDDLPPLKKVKTDDLPPAIMKAQRDNGMRSIEDWHDCNNSLGCLSLTVLSFTWFDRCPSW